MKGPADKFDPDRRRAFLDLCRVVDQGVDPGLRDAQTWSMVRHRIDLVPRNRSSSNMRPCAGPARGARRWGRGVQSLDKHQLRQRIATEVGVPLHDRGNDGRPACGLDYSAECHAVPSDDEGREVDRRAEKDDSAQSPPTSSRNSHDREAVARLGLITRHCRPSTTASVSSCAERKLREEPRTAGKPRHRTGPVQGTRAPARGPPPSPKMRKDARGRNRRRSGHSSPHDPSRAGGWAYAGRSFSCCPSPTASPGGGGRRRGCSADDGADDHRLPALTTRDAAPPVRVDRGLPVVLPIAAWATGGRPGHTAPVAGASDIVILR